ncbi:hypothetical protein B0J11DRAFT_504759 [Dendryphion nanum]|uniref:Uncharacterized protein n=1 Tax=Dendryphion nanum TaxID=256645 RepID=A0A9P9E0B0_9PLEO|nr:hypothetical protein B0J11DRAFT_504759 [Dendryphion nanum]
MRHREGWSCRHGLGGWLWKEGTMEWREESGEWREQEFCARRWPAGPLGGVLPTDCYLYTQTALLRDYCTETTVQRLHRDCTETSRRLHKEREGGKKKRDKDVQARSALLATGWLLDGYWKVKSFCESLGHWSMVAWSLVVAWSLASLFHDSTHAGQSMAWPVHAPTAHSIAVPDPHIHSLRRRFLDLTPLPGLFTQPFLSLCLRRAQGGSFLFLYIRFFSTNCCSLVLTTLPSKSLHFHFLITTTITTVSSPPYPHHRILTTVSSPPDQITRTTLTQFQRNLSDSPPPPTPPSRPHYTHFSERTDPSFRDLIFFIFFFIYFNFCDIDHHRLEPSIDFCNHSPPPPCQLG